jgi:hypothetical protein
MLRDNLIQAFISRMQGVNHHQASYAADLVLEVLQQQGVVFDTPAGGYAKASSVHHQKAAPSGLEKQVPAGFQKAAPDGFQKQVPASFQTAAPSGFQKQVPAGFQKAATGGFQKAPSSGFQKQPPGPEMGGKGGHGFKK